LRLWPGLVAVTLQWLLWLGLPAVAPEQGGTAIVGGLVLGLVVFGWWLFASRTPWLERLGLVAVIVLAVAVTRGFVHASITGGMMGFMLFIYAIPAMSLALVVGATLSRRMSNAGRRATMAAAVLVGCAAFTLIRTEGMTGDSDSQLAWRWTPTAEDRLLAESPGAPADPTSAGAASTTADLPEAGMEVPPGAPEAVLPRPPAADVAAPAPEVPPVASGESAADAEWPGFRGPARNSIAGGVRIDTDWSTSPPVELWRHPVGPGWSSFAVQGNRIFTQEQRGDDEVIACYDRATGEAVWMHRDAARFWESNAGAGPRGTPTVWRGRVFAFGATGILNALDAEDGSVVWSRNAAVDTGVAVPDWGFASSPVVTDELVVIATAGVLVAYHAETGELRWMGPKGGLGYASPQLETIDGVEQLVFLDGAGITGVAPADGSLLWRHEWSGDGILQPAIVGSRDLLFGSGSGLNAAVGTRRITVTKGPGRWTVDERWTSRGLKPYFNDFVVHEGYAYGFDGSILAAISLEDGARAWKGGRYGHGQLVLLAEQDLLLVLSEDGELALVGATPDRFMEVARVPAIEGKTWNHPVLVGDVLLVRNGEEMAAFRLPLAAR
jgi:outer membrane protein assembly factor BamB